MTPAEAATETVERAIAGYNARDAEAVADAFHFPHVRIASGTVLVIPSREEFVPRTAKILERGLERGWERSTLDAADVVHERPEKVHLAITFTRYDADGNALNSYDSLWIVTNHEGRWGVQARSSFAP